VQDHHDFDEMQEYLDFGSQGGTCRISPLQPAGQHKTSQPRKPGLGSEATRKVLKPPKTPARLAVATTFAFNRPDHKP